MDLTDPLREAVRRLLDRYADSPAVRAAAASPAGYDTALWKRLAGEIGVAGLAIPERYGGAGAGLRETQVVLEELGRRLVPSPLLGSAVLTARAVLASGDGDACERLLPGIADGTRIAALAWVGPDGHWRPDEVACTAGPDGTLTGEAHYVLDGDRADVLIVAARTPDGIGLFEVPEFAATTSAAMDITRRLAVVRLAGTTGRRLGGDARAVLARVRDVACLALAAEQAGSAARALELTVEYTKVRRQFDRPIGSFQALQHRMADLHVLVETARSAAYADGADLSLAAAVAKVHCSEALMRVAGEMIQLHGGIGITWEHDAHLYLKRAHGSWHLFGQPAEHVARLAPAVLAP